MTTIPYGLRAKSNLLHHLALCCGAAWIAACSSASPTSNDLTGGNIEGSSSALFSSLECQARAVNGKVGICHATSSKKNPYNHLSVSVSVCTNGHAGHVDDFLSDDETCTSCVPTNCAELGAGCGNLPNGCGGTLDCGTCTPPQTCGGGGVPYQCGSSCTPTTCADAGATCGSISDGCGGTLTCGTCTAPQSCGGAGIPNHCGCTPATCGEQCGQVSDGCGGTIDCGACCQALDPCHVAGVRDPVTGLCSNPPAPDQTPCDDQNACTSGDQCTDGYCAGTPYVCNDGLACTTDACNGDGTCSHSIVSGSCVGDGACHLLSEQADPEPAPATSNEPVPLTTLNGEALGIDVSWDGRYTLGVLNPTPWNILYGWPGDPWSNSASVRIDGNNRRFGELGSDNEFMQYPYVADPSTTVTKWRTGSIAVTQTLRIVSNPMTGSPDMVKIQFDIANLDSEVHEVGVRILMDTMINSQDGAPFRVPTQADPITGETEFLDADVPSHYQAFFSLADLTHVVQGTLSGMDATRPDRLAMVYWWAASQTYWDYAITPGGWFGNPYYPDSAVLLYWNPQPIDPGASLRRITYYGLGGLSGGGKLAISGPAQLRLSNNAWTPQPFTVVAYLENDGPTPKTGESLTLSLAASGLALADGETATHALPEIPAFTTVQSAWRVVATASGTWTYGVTTSSSPPLSAERTVGVPEPWTCAP